MNVIDIHTHAFPDALAARAIPALEEEAHWTAALDGTIGALLGSMDAAGVAVSVVCAIATKPDQAAGIFDWCGRIRSDRIIPFPSIHPDTPDPAAWLKRFADEGFRGIKLHPMYQDFAIDDDRAMPIYAAAAECGLIVQVHCGRDIAFPPDDDRAAPRRTRRVLDAVNGLKIIATHMGGWRMWDESEALLVGTSAYMETSFSLHEMPPGRAVAMIRRHGTDRVLFGTDSPWAAQAAELDTLGALGLTDDERERILSANAVALLGR